MIIFTNFRLEIKHNIPLESGNFQIFQNTAKSVFCIYIYVILKRNELENDLGDLTYCYQMV